MAATEIYKPYWSNISCAHVREDLSAFVCKVHVQPSTYDDNDDDDTQWIIHDCMDSLDFFCNFCQMSQWMYLKRVANLKMRNPVDTHTWDLHCSTATPDVQSTKHLFLTVHAAVTPTNVLPAPGSIKR